MVRNRPRWLHARHRGQTIGCGLCWGFFILAGCQRGNTYQAPPPPKVEVTTPGQQTITVYHQYTGTTQAAELADYKRV